MGFLACCAGAAVCFLVAFLTLPLLAIKPRKFAVAFSLGSILFMGGFCVLQGPVGFFRHLVGPERLPFTAVYLGSLAATLYFAIGQQAYLFTLIAGLAQIAALVSFLFAYFPCVERSEGQLTAQGRLHDTAVRREHGGEGSGKSAAGVTRV